MVLLLKIQVLAKHDRLISAPGPYHARQLCSRPLSRSVNLARAFSADSRGSMSDTGLGPGEFIGFLSSRSSPFSAPTGLTIAFFQHGDHGFGVIIRQLGYVIR